MASAVRGFCPRDSETLGRGQVCLPTKRPVQGQVWGLPTPPPPPRRVRRVRLGRRLHRLAGAPSALETSLTLDSGESTPPQPSTQVTTKPSTIHPPNESFLQRWSRQTPSRFGWRSPPAARPTAACASCPGRIRAGSSNMTTRTRRATCCSRGRRYRCAAI